MSFILQSVIGRWSLVGLPAGALSSQLGQLSLPSLGVGKSSTGLWLVLKRGAFTCVGWKVTLRDK